MRTVHALIAAGQTDTGRQRDVNEDRFYCDPARGLFIVIDGVGGQAAGGKAADVALSILRKRLERETEPVAERVRKAITNANNEIYRVARTRPEWNGMACVLTVAVIGDGRVTIGHVGDTRLYKLRNHAIEKITRDHSPVGEREDSKEISELQAMRHPRRNEVYRDVGSEHHTLADPEFIDIEDVPFEPDSALLLCSDGLSDLVESATIANVINRSVGDPEAVSQTLIATANAAGGKDNITVVYVEGEQFAASQSRRGVSPSIVMRPPMEPPPRSATLLRHLIVAVAALAIGLAIGRTGLWLPFLQRNLQLPSNTQIVRPTESINAAIQKALPGSQILVEPGEYRERVVLKDGIRLMSRVPREATIRLPIDVSDADSGPAVVATGLSNAEFSGFRIVGDAATPLGVAIGIANGGLSINNVDISGAAIAGIDFGEGSSATLLGSAIHDNPGAAIFVRAGANPRLSNNVFTRNGMSERAPGNVVIEAGGKPVFQDNVIVGLSPESFVTLDELGRLQLKDSNWFLPGREPARPAPEPDRGRGVGGPAGCKEAAERCAELNRTVSPTLKKTR
jgi:serine/threonine protein phosphatase PrpC